VQTYYYTDHIVHISTAHPTPNHLPLADSDTLAAVKSKKVRTFCSGQAELFLT